jgi:2-polyprenyl-3-methyl-5-hydroxy-6-metoxy-1,4-benzoquinol methylase
MLSTWLESGAAPPDERDVEGLVGEILDHGWATPEAAFRVAVRVLRRDQAVGRALAAAARHDSDVVDGAVALTAFAAAMARPLAREVLRKCLVTAPDVELVLTRWRRSLALTGSAAAPLDAVVSLALQCWLNEFVFAETKQEVDALARRPATAADLAVTACYRRLTEADFNGVDPDPALEALRRSHCADPAAERSLGSTILDLTAVTDPVSTAVRDQYQSNPYPRWVVCQREQPRRLGEFFSAMTQAYGAVFPHPGPHPEILIAGCGTGLQAIQCASQFPDARVTGLDLSRPSLAYASRAAAALGLRNLTFSAGDILALGTVESWKTRFAYMECLGVLHHLANPADGLAALTGCLMPGGLMYLGLYSATARRSIQEARALIARETLTSDPAGIRRFRRLVVDLARKSGPRADAIRPVTGFLDFYSLSMCRDLAFHVQEHQFKPAGVAALIAGAGLELLGFGLPDPELAGAYAHDNPIDPMVRDPARLAAFERKHPTAFAAQYLCLARKPVG